MSGETALDDSPLPLLFWVPFAVLGETFRHPVYLDSFSSFFFALMMSFSLFFPLQFHFFQIHTYNKPIGPTRSSGTYSPCKILGR